MTKSVIAGLLFLAGMALAAALAVHAGAGAIVQTFQAIGWGRLLVVCLFQFVALALCAAAWRCVARETTLAACLLARWIRDGASNLVGFIPAIGEAISARMLTQFGGSSGGAAAAGTIVDVATEALAQAIFTIGGLVLLWPHLKFAQTGQWLLIVAATLIPIVLMVALSRFPGALRLGERLGSRLAGVFGVEPGSAPLNIAAAVKAIYQGRGKVAGGIGFHLAAWAMSGLQVWVAVQGLPHPLGLADCFALASLVSAARSAFFLVPWAAGVQEGGFMLVGLALGMHAPEAIALSLVLRARDVLVGAPAVLIWYFSEARTGLRRSLAGGPQPGPSK